MAHDIGTDILVLAQRLGDLVEHGAERRLDAGAVGIEGHLAGDVHLQRAVRLLGDLGAGAGGVLVQLAADGIPVVAGRTADRTAHGRADQRAGGIAADQVAKPRAHRGAYAGTDRRMGLLFGGAARSQQGGGGERDSDELDLHAFSF
ncbi:hypothetical protein D3C81_1218620 [compost metagenome]